MNLNLKLNTEECSSCDIILHDMTLPTNYGYTNESYIGYIPGRLKYSETIGIAVLKQNSSIPSKSITLIDVNYHSDSDTRSFTIKNPPDSWYTASLLVMPSATWFQRELNILSGKVQGESQLGAYKVIYFTDGLSYYKAIKNLSTGVYELSEITIDELLICSVGNTTLSRECLDYVSICFLSRCHLDLSMAILNSDYIKCKKNTTESSTNYERDLIFMGINTINYLVGFNELSEAQRIIEQLESCNGVCKQSYANTSKSGGCGCSK